MFENVEKITRVVIQPSRNLRLRLHVKLLQEREGRKENFHSLFEKPSGDGEILTLDAQSFLTLEIVDRGEWNAKKSLLIDQRNIYQVIKGFEKCLKALYNEKIFDKRQNGEIFAYREAVEKNTIPLYYLGGNNRMVLRPTVVYDMNEVSYEGVAIHINTKEYVAELAIDAFEALYYALKQANLFVYSQLMLNYFVSALREEKIELREVKKEKKIQKSNKTHPLLHSGPKEEVKQQGFNEETPEKFFGMENQ